MLLPDRPLAPLVHAHGLPGRSSGDCKRAGASYAVRPAHGPTAQIQFACQIDPETQP